MCISLEWRSYLFTLDLDGDHVSLGADDVAQQVALLVIRHPDHLLAIVRLGLVLSLHLQGDDQILARIGVFGHCCCLLVVRSEQEDEEEGEQKRGSLQRDRVFKQVELMEAQHHNNCVFSLCRRVGKKEEEEEEERGALVSWLLNCSIGS